MKQMAKRKHFSDQVLNFWDKGSLHGSEIYTFGLFLVWFDSTLDASKRTKKNKKTVWKPGKKTF